MSTLSAYPSTMVKSPNKKENLRRCETTIIGEYIVKKEKFKKNKKNKTQTNDELYKCVLEERKLEKDKNKKQKLENFEALDSLRSFNDKNIEYLCFMEDASQEM